MFTVSVKCNCTRGATSSATFYHYAEGHSFSLDHVTCGGLAGSSAICFAASISTSLRETNDPVLGRGTADYEGKSVEKREETITRFLHDFANFNGHRKKKKKGFDPFFGRDSFGDKTLDLWLRFFTIHTANRETVFPRKLIAQRIMKYRVAPFDRSWIVPFVFLLRSVTRQCLI